MIPLSAFAWTVSSPTLFRVLFADDHTIVRAGVISLLLRSGACDVVAEASNGVEVVRHIHADGYLVKSAPTLVTVVQYAVNKGLFC